MGAGYAGVCSFRGRRLFPRLHVLPDGNSGAARAPDLLEPLLSTADCLCLAIKNYEQ